MKQKKIGIVLLAIVLLLAAFWASNTFLSGDAGSKTIYITAVDDTSGKILLDKKPFQTDADTLGTFLAEEKDLNAKLTGSAYGRFLESLLELETIDMASGPWWMYGYTSPKEKINLKVGEAPGVDALAIYDQDEVEFHYMANPGF